MPGNKKMCNRIKSVIKNLGKMFHACVRRDDVYDKRPLSDELYKTVFENSAVAITVSDENENIVFWNKYAENLLGMNEHDLYMKPVSALYPEEEWRRMRSLNVRRKGMQHHMEMKVIRGDNELLDIDISLSILKGPDGNVTGSIGVMRDITARRQAEVALQARERRFREIFNNVSDLIFYMHSSGIFIDVNRRCFDLFGLSPQEMIGRSFTDLDIFDDGESMRLAVQFIDTLESENRATPQINMQARHRDGHKLSIEVSIRAITGEDSTLDGFLGLIRDITERRQAEEEIIQKNRKLEIVNDLLRSSQEQLMQSSKLAAIGELVSGVAHEVNNPLTTVLMRSEILLDMIDDEEVLGHIKAINRQAERAIGIVKNLLSFARKQDTEKAFISVNDSIETVVSLRSYELGLDNINIALELDPDLPSTMADSQQLQQVFLNIVTNAEQAIKDVDSKGEITIQSQTVGDVIQVTVADDGPGISKDIMGRIFEPFYTTKELGKGTGLGLSICHGIIGDHGGQIRIESAEGEGTTFTIELPIVGLSDDDEGAIEVDPDDIVSGTGNLRTSGDIGVQTGIGGSGLS